MPESARAVIDRSRALGGEFKAFITKGNVLDLAVAVIIGGAFGKIVSSLVADVIMPPLGMLLARVDFKHLKVVLQPAVKNADGTEATKEVALAYGAFLQNTLDFLIIAFVIFICVKVVTKMTTRPAAPAEPTAKDCPKCLMSIPFKAVKCGHCTADLT